MRKTLLFVTAAAFVMSAALTAAPANADEPNAQDASGETTGQISLTIVIPLTQYNDGSMQDNATDTPTVNPSSLSGVNKTVKQSVAGKSKKAKVISKTKHVKVAKTLNNINKFYGKRFFLF
jgi:hypothetical protein